MAMILLDLGVESVGTAADASQGLHVAREARPDAVLVDIGLPDRDGADPAYEYATLATIAIDVAACELRVHAGGPCSLPVDGFAGAAAGT